MITTNLHTHTYRCGHASGTDREYIEQALAAGLQTLGFSDHAPLPNPYGGTESSFRVKTGDAEDYFRSLQSLRREYEDRLTLHIGLEMEYYEPIFTDTLHYVQDLGAEYLILGQHFTRCEYTGGGAYMGHPFPDTEILKEYVRAAVRGMETGCFSYLAHPDLANFVGKPEIYDQWMRTLVREVAAMDYPLEINRYGYADKRHYPNDRFWRIAAEEGARVVIGLDAHSPQVFADGKTVAELEEYLKSLGMTAEESKVICLK